MIDSLPLLTAAFAAGLLGSAHCLGMCAGLSGLFAAGASVASLRSQLPLALAYNAGRVASYAVLGLVVATFGGAMVEAVPRLAAPVRLLSGAMIIVVGLQVAFGWRLLAAVERGGAVVWQRIAPLAKGLIPAESVGKAAALGLVWGWLPCGLVYSALLIAATTASALDGATVMIAFGAGTMPAMVLSGLSASKLSAFMNRNRLTAGLLIVLLGIATLAMPVSGLFNQSGHKHHMSSLQNPAVAPASPASFLRTTRKQHY
ncbi:MAG: sulfite exporter TauE/SafE family protein [Gammaproteobacteria bacterium]|nr:sulfite exporter TauE/SafE family protein [Gammaproteobacteria bacterium]